MSIEFTLAFFTEIARGAGFKAEEIKKLFETSDIDAEIEPNALQGHITDKILALDIACGKGWLDGSSRFCRTNNLDKPTPREIIAGSEEGLAQFVSSVESVLRKPLPPTLG